MPGRSGNPGGRIGSSEEFKRIRALYRDRTDTAVYEAERLMRESDDDRVRLAACQLITERGWGKASEAYSPETDPDERRAQIDWFRVTPEQRAELRQYVDFLHRLPRVADGAAPRPYQRRASETGGASGAYMMLPADPEVAPAAR